MVYTTLCPIFLKQISPSKKYINIRWIMEKAREFQKDIFFCFIDYAKAFNCVDHNKLWEILKEMGIPDHLTCLLRNSSTLVTSLEELTHWKRL